MRWRDSRSGSSNGSITALSLFLLFLFAAHCTAQGLTDLPNLTGLSSVTLGGDSTSEASSTARETDDDDSSRTTRTASSSDNRATTTAATTSARSTSRASTITGVDVTLTNGISVSSSTSTESSTSRGGSIFHLSDLPTIAGATIPTPTVPFTANAPFMQKSSLPEGSVFIIVGAILGFFGACVLAWRGLVAWSLSRSVKRAAIAQHQTFDLKSTKYPPSNGPYSQPPMGSAASIERLTAVAQKSLKRGSHRPSTADKETHGPGVLNTRASTQNLFFSPTAGAGHHSQLPSPHTQQNRGSAYLPAGYYASGTSQPAGGQGTTHINAHAQTPRGSSILNPLSDRLSGIRAESAGYQRTHSFGPSPPGSPGLAPTPPSGAASRTMSPGNASSVVGQVSGPTGGLYSSPSYSTLNLSVPSGTQQQSGRTPSAYLEDLFENHGNGPRERF